MGGRAGFEISVVLVFFVFRMEPGISAVEGKKRVEEKRKSAAVNANNDGTSGETSSLLALYFPTGERL